MKTASPVVMMKEVGQGESPLDLLSDMENMAGNLTAGDRLTKIASKVASNNVRMEFYPNMIYFRAFLNINKGTTGLELFKKAFEKTEKEVYASFMLTFQYLKHNMGAQPVVWDKSFDPSKGEIWMVLQPQLPRDSDKFTPEEEREIRAYVAHNT